MRIMAIDPGTKRLGVALSDLTRIVARPLEILEHKSRNTNAETIARLADENKVGLIVVGHSTDDDGTPTPHGRSAARLAGAIRKSTDIPVELWDESGSTQAARRVKIKVGITRKKRIGHLDEFAAMVILQSYLDAHSNRQVYQIDGE